MCIEDIKKNSTVYVVRRYHYRRGSGDGTGIWRGSSFDGFPEFETIGNISERNCKIVDNYSGQTVVVISKKGAEGDTYFVSVNPKYDSMLMVFLAIIINHVHHGLAGVCAKAVTKTVMVATVGDAFE